jgi:hypothetical protein
LKRVSRFGITAETLWNTIGEPSPTGTKKAKFTQILETLFRGGTLVTGVSLCAHLLDQLDWGLINQSEACEYADVLFNQMGMSGLEKPEDGQDAADFLIAQLERGLAELISTELIQMKNETPEGAPH